MISVYMVIKLFMEYHELLPVLLVCGIPLVAFELYVEIEFFVNKMRG